MEATQIIVECGFFGKAPTHGDFLRRRVPEDFLQPWDGWLQSCVAESRQALGVTWLETYLTSPIWRFALGAGVCGSDAAIGVLMPSVDKVGRYFPMTVVTAGLGHLSPPLLAEVARGWYDEVERAVLSVVADDGFKLDDFDAQIAASARHPELLSLSHFERAVPITGATSTLALWAPLAQHGSPTPVAWTRMLADSLHLSGRKVGLWWTIGSERIPSSLLVTEGLPVPGTFRAMLDGDWVAGGWSVGTSLPGPPVADDALGGQPQPQEPDVPVVPQTQAS